MVAKFSISFLLFFASFYPIFGADNLIDSISSSLLKDSGPLSKDNITYCGQTMLPKNYNKLILPVPKQGTFTETSLSLYIRSIMDINEQDGEIDLDADLGMQWFDQSLYVFHELTNWTDLETGMAIGNTTYGSEILDCIWNPDVFFDQLLDVKRTSVLAKMVQVNFAAPDLDSSGAGDVTYSSRMKIKLKCGMSFEYYPADIQTCIHYIRSYSYTADKLVLYWRFEKLFLDDPYNPNFDIMISEVEPMKKYHEYFIQENFDKFRSGNYSALYFVVKARRRLSYHLVQTYLPSCLLIFITWLCFLLPSEMVEARIGISMTTVLTLTAMFAAIREQSPKVSYTMAIDIWMVFNIFIVFIALFLFAIIYWMKLRVRKRKEIEEAMGNVSVLATSIIGKANDLPQPQAVYQDGINPETYDNIVRFSKRYAFWMFAIIFFLFFTTYWTWLLTSSGYFDWDPPAEFNADLDKAGVTGRYGGHGSPTSVRVTSLERIFEDCKNGSVYTYKPAFAREYNASCPPGWEKLGDIIPLLKQEVANSSSSSHIVPLSVSVFLCYLVVLKVMKALLF